jgi:hypothetical protein
MWLEDHFGSGSMLQRNERVKLAASFWNNVGAGRHWTSTFPRLCSAAATSDRLQRLCRCCTCSGPLLGLSGHARCISRCPLMEAKI